MIKATEMMIGDWYEWHPDAIPSKMHYERVTAKTFGFPKRCFDAMNPIPLTAKILEKNGIKFQYGRPWYQWHNDKIQIVCEEVRLCVDYVHELQHALRLCGLDELADNFKID